MPLNPICCDNAEKEIVNRLAKLLKPYIQQRKNNRETVELIKNLVAVSIHFSNLIDVYKEDSISPATANSN